MPGYAAALGSPHFLNMLPRCRLTRLMGTAGQRAIILSAPSGFGKTVAAADFAARQPLPVIWLSLAGEAVDYSRCLRAITDLLSGPERLGDVVDRSCTVAQQERLCMSMLAEHCRSGALLVLDDVGLGGGVDASCLSQEILARLRHNSIRVVTTTQQAGFVNSSALVVDHRVLAFSRAEAHEMVRVLGRTDLSDVVVDGMLDATAGHPAVTTVLLAASSPAGMSEPPTEAVIAIRRMIDRLNSEEKALLEALRFLRRATASELEQLGFVSAEEKIYRLASAVPLIRAMSTDDDGLVAITHDLLAEVESCNPHRLLEQQSLDLAVVLSILTANNGRQQLRALFSSCQHASGLAEWLESNSEHAIDKLSGGEVCELLGRLPLTEMVKRPRLMLLWSSLLIENGQFEEAVSKARVSCRLAEQERDAECSAKSAAVIVDALSLAGRTGEAWRAGTSYLAQQQDDGTAPSLRCDLLAALARAAAVSGRDEDFKAIEQQAAARASADPVRCSPAMRRIKRSRSTLQAIMSEWTGAAETLLQLLANDLVEDLTTRLIIRGNLAICLIESGRLTRAQGLLATVIGAGNLSVDGSYLLALGMAQAGAGELAEGVTTAERGVRISASLGDELDVNMSRLSLACMQRAAGLLAESLETAERAYEGLGNLEVAGLREIAATEVAASLVAMDDPRAARKWLGPGQSISSSPYRGLRASMVLAECSRREGRIDSGVTLLSEYAGEIRSENSNWQMAMYVRAFPHLLAMLASAAGADELPIHMLRMLVPENVEAALRVGRSILQTDEWEVLGRRALGGEAFSEHLRRKGRPMCRVRFFGGLEVCVDDRVVQERDWAKRKARSVFAILAARQGQEVARDQILEHLWPDMDPTRAKNNFYVAWSAMKAALRAVSDTAECSYVDNTRGRCRVVREWVRTDLDEFDELIAQARAAEADGRVKDAASAYSQLMTVYRGELLAGDIYDDWFATQREHYRVEFLDAMLRATQLLLDADEPSEALMFARRGLAVDPFREDLYQDALRCHILAGQRSAAIETFLQCKAQLADELGLDPSGDTLKLYQQVLAMEERARYEIPGPGFLD